VGVDHLGEVHAVDVVRADHDDDVRALVLDDVQALEDGVRGAQVPVLAHSLLSGDGGDVVAEQGRHPPGLGDVTVQAVRLVLGEHDDVQVVGVDQVRQGKVDKPVDPAEGHGGFGTVCRQRLESVAFATCEDDRENFRACHAMPLKPKSPDRSKTRYGVDREN